MAHDPASAPRIIGIHGLAGSGKDTLAQSFIEEFGFVRYSFALPIKLALNAMFGFTEGDWDNRNWKESEILSIDRSPRYLAQTLGTEWGRNTVHPDLWLILANRFCHGKSVVIPDVRFNNEAEWIKKSGGKIIHVLRPSQSVINESRHVSEAGIASLYVDDVILNDGDISDLVRQGKDLGCSWGFSPSFANRSSS